MDRCLFFFLSLVLMSDGLLAFLIPVIVYSETGSLGYSGLAYFLWWLPRILMVSLVGTFIDKWGVKPVAICSDMLKILGCTLVAIISTSYSNPLMFSLAAGLLGGIVSVSNSQTIISYEKMISLKSGNIEKDSNLISRLDLLGMILWPIIGIIFFEYGFKFLLLLSSIIYGLNALFFIFSSVIPKNEQHYNKIKLTLLSSLKEINSKPIIIFMIILAIGNNMFDGVVESSGAAVISQFMSLPIQYFGFIDICAGIFGFSATYLYSFLICRFDSNSVFTLGWFVAIVSSLSMIIFIDNIYIFLISYSISISSKVFMGNYMRVTRIKLIPRYSLASVSSLIILLNQSILPAVGIFVYIADKHNIETYYLLLISIAITAIAGGTITISSLRKSGNEQYKTI